jgi:hypothetical protein
MVSYVGCSFVRYQLRAAKTYRIINWPMVALICKSWYETQAPAVLNRKPRAPAAIL